MSHQPYESWLLSEEPLMPNQVRELDDHLESCASCRHLSAAWEEVKNLLQDPPVEKPVAGFTERWQARVTSLGAEENLWQQRRTSLLFFSFTAGASLIILITLGINYFTVVQSPVEFFISSASLFAGLLALVSAFQVAFIPFIEVFLVSVPPLWWVLFVIGFSSFLLIWTFSLRRILFPRRVSL